jgi:hypothetical protein
MGQHHEYAGIPAPRRRCHFTGYTITKRNVYKLGRGLVHSLFSRVRVLPSAKNALRQNAPYTQDMAIPRALRYYSCVNSPFVGGVSERFLV